MSNSALTAAARQPPLNWWREAHAWAALLLVAATYLARLNQPTLQGEETRRALVAEEMLRTGDWIVPREQGLLFPDRPPLGNWSIALAQAITGSRQPWAVRLPSVVATMLTAWLIYVYARTFLSSLAAAAAACAYGTLGQVLQLGRLAETEAVFTLLVAASLLGWHLSWLRNWPHLAAWVVGYSFAGLAALAKGPQGPLYFAGPVIVYLALQRQWRRLFSWQHLVGLAAGAVVVGAWHVPYARQVEGPVVLQTWGALAAARFDYSQLTDVVGHLLTFPVEVFACLLPWSLLLWAYLSPTARAALRHGPCQARFLLLAIALAFPTCWLAPQARGRYLMPLYPCFCPLIALVIEHAMQNVAQTWQNAWRRFCSIAAVAVFIGGMAVLAAALAGSILARQHAAGIDWRGKAIWLGDLLSQPVWFAWGYFVAAVLAAMLAWHGRCCRPERAHACVFGLAAFLGLTYAGVVVNVQVHAQNDVAAAVARVRRQIPPGERLVSIGTAYHRFVYWYGEPIEVIDPQSAAVPKGWRYFCFHQAGSHAAKLPFAYEEIAVIGCDRRRDEPLFDRVVVARRLDVTASPGEAVSGLGGPRR
jgi:4-amino-4-deoxy-L-arabinose transferase-like glycosyltransferase